MISGQIDDNAELEISFTSSKHANMHFRPDIIDSRFVDALDGVKLNSSTGEDFFWDIFTPANNSNELIDYVTGAEVSNKKSYLKSLEAIIRTNIGDINFAYGLQINKENLQIYYDEISEAKFDDKGQILKTADLFFLGGGINVSKSRKKYAAFFEAGKSLKNFSGRFSGRFEKFNNVSSFDPKLSFKYKLIDGFYLRASRGSSFSMPSMAQMYSSDINLGSIRDINDNNPFIRQAKIGNPELKPASSVNKNVGFLFTNSSQQIAIDYWSLDFTDRVTGESAQALLDQNPFGESVTRNENGDLIGVTTSYFNEENTKISGVDVSYKITIFESPDHGVLSANLEASSLEKFLTPSGVGTNELINRIGKFNYDTHLYSLPKIRINTSLGLNVKNYNYRIAARYIDGYDNSRVISTRGLQLGYKNKVESFLVIDLSIQSYISFKGGVLNYKLSASNIFDESSPRVYDAPDFSFDSRAHDPRGRIIGLNFEYRK
jgi:outer membrane receptor protein involved in Fe transport